MHMFTVNKHNFLVAIFSYASLCFGHGIGSHTPVTVYSDTRHIHQIHYLVQNDQAFVVSYDLANKQNSLQIVKASREHQTNCYFAIGFSPSDTRDILCTPTQEFYLPAKQQWVPAYQLHIGDELLNTLHVPTPITHLEFIEQPLVVYVLEVECTHNFFVGRHRILTHNIILPAAYVGLSVAFGSGAAAGATAGSFFGPVTLCTGFAVGGLIAIGMQTFRNHKEQVNYSLEFNATALEAFSQNKVSFHTDNNDAQAPGKPTKKDGFIPRKNWNGEKVRHQGTGQVGYPDRNGDIWVPTGPGSKAHGGPHWDVVPSSKKKQPVNVYPGGKIR